MTCVDSILSEAVSKIGKCLVGSIGKQCGYLINYKKNVDKLKGEYKTLQDKKEGLKGQVKEAERNGHKILPIVNSWLMKVVDIESKMKRFDDEERKMKRKCLGGWCPNLLSYYSLGRKATKKFEDISSLLKEGNFRVISYSAPPPRLGSRKKTLKKIIEKLKDEKIQKISIYGMEGVEKTTLVKEVIKMIESNKLFDEVAMAVVSQDPNYEDIQNQIADRLGLKWTIESLEGRAEELLQRLKGSKRVLIVLHDVRKELDFKLVGLPSYEGCKIIFTSINEQVCRKMGSLHNFPISALSDNEAWSLFESRKDIVAKIKQTLQDEKIERLGICGMGGVGKTTLVKQVITEIETEAEAEAEIETNKLFDKVAMAVVSQNADYENIQSQIADCLNFKFSNKSVQGRATELLGKLTNEKVLIVLDDVWKELDFELLGLPSHEGCKIIFTSRNEQVCRKMGSKKNFLISVLSDEEAWILFRDMASGDVVDKPDINSIARQVAEECGGLPLAIVTVGKALRNKKKHAWQDALQQLRKSQVTAFSDMQERVYSSIELSYTFLASEEHKSCLLLCGLFPEDYDIPIEIVMRYGVGMGYFTGVGELWIARDRVHTLVDDLKGCFLLLDSHEEGCVKMHNVVRDVVITIASRAEHEFMLQPDAEIMELPEHNTWDHVNAISLLLDETKKLRNGLQCPKLKLLHGASNNQEIPWSENFFCGMNELQVLGMENLHVPKMSSLLQTLDNLRTLRVEDCQIGDISIIGIQLVNLKILSFARSNIKILPKEIGHLSSLRLLDLQGCDDLYKIHSNVLARLSRLEELYFIVDNFPWSQNNEALDELKNLSHQLKVLEISIRKVEYLPEELVIGNLVRFWVGVGRAIFNFYHEEYPGLKELHIADANYNFIKSNSILEPLAKECEFLCLEDVKYLENVIYKLNEGRFPHLKHQRIKDCSNLKYLMDCSTHPSAFPLLESLSLADLKNLKVICNISSHHESEKSMMEFSNLVKLSLQDLSSLIGFTLNESFQSNSQVEESSTINKSGKLFTSNCMQCFPKLKTIWLESCDSLEILFDFQECSQLDSQTQSVSVFPRLEEVRICFLNQLTGVWGPNPQFVKGFRNMRFLEVFGCDSLRYVFTPTIVRALSQLECIRVSCCNKMEKLVDDDDNDGEPVWPSLRELFILKCPMLKISSWLTKTYAKKEDNRNIVRQDSNLQNVGFSSSKHDFPISFKRCLECKPMAKLSKTSSKATSPKDHVPNFVKKSKLWSSCMPVLEELFIDDCDTLDVLFPLEENGHSSIPPSLKTVKVSNCNKLEAIILKDMNSFKRGAFDEDRRRMTKSKREMEANVLPTLEHLILECLLNLKAFCQGSFKLNFSSLQKVEIKDCNNMEVFSHGSSDTPKLVDVTIRLGEYSSNNIHRGDLNDTIQQMKEFVDLQKKEAVKWGEQEVGVRSYCIKEREMIVEHFDKLLKVVQFNDIGMIKHIEKFRVSHCHSVVELFESDATMTQCELQVRHLCASGLVSFEKLRLLIINNCDNLESLFSPSVAKSLVQLQQLKVQSCKKMEEIVTKESEGDNNSEATISLPKLSNLDLSNLPNFKCFCSGVNHLDLPSLVEFNYETCPQFTAFSNGIVTTSKDLHVNARPHTMCAQGNLNLAIYYINNFEKYKEELQKLETFRWIEQDQHLDGYITRVTTLVLEGCEKLLSCVPCNMKHRFQHLKNLQVKDCGALKEIFESGASEGNSMMQYELERMSLDSLPKLRHIWTNNDGGVLSFRSLNTLHISGCHDLKSVFPLSMAKSLRKLQDIHVCDCDMIEEIVTITEKDENITFPELSELKLENLPNLERFCSGNCNFELPTCESITLTSLPRLKHIDALKSVLSLSVSGSLPELRSLHVSNCQMMEEIFTTKDDEISQEPEEHIIIFPTLYELKLQKLPRLNCFYAGSCHFKSSWFGSVDIIIEECSKMETFCHGIVITPLECTTFINGIEYSSMEDLNQIIRHHNKSETPS